MFRTLLMASALVASPLFAQAYDANSSQPAPASPNPGTTAANNAVLSASDMSQARTTEGQAQYDADREAYMAALAQHDRAVDRADARWAHQQAAYADAMAAWRWQAAACKRGNQRACNMPTPNPADFY